MGILHGAMTDSSGNEQVTEQTISAFNNLAKKKIALAYFTHHWKSKVEPFPKSMCDAAHNQGAIPFLRMNAYEAKTTSIDCAAILSGKHDSDIKLYAQAAKAWNNGATIFAELGTEVNGNFLAFSKEGPDKYKAMSKKFIDIFRAEGANNVRFVFHGDFNDLSSHPKQWYLGDQYYDYIGSSFYGQDNGKGCIGSIRSNYNAWANTGNKPLAVLEWGLGNSIDTRDTLANIPNEFPRINIMCYWNEKGSFDRRIDKTAENLKAYQDGIADPAYLDNLNPLPSSPPTVDSLPPSGGSGNIGPDGVRELYPTIQGGTTWHMDNQAADLLQDPCFSLDGINSDVKLSRNEQNGVTWFTGKSSPVKYHSGGNGSTLRFGIYAEQGSKGQKQKHIWKERPAFMWGPKGILNHEFTVYVLAKGQIGAGKHMSCAFKVDGGKEDAGRSLVETCYPISSRDHVRANYNFEHFPYEAVKGVKEYFSGDYLRDGVIVGLKHIRIMHPDSSYGTYYLHVDTDPFDSNGKPKNNWKLKGSWVDRGTPGYQNIVATWRSQVDKLRVDGYSEVSIALMSIREIDPTVKLADEHPLMSAKHNEAVMLGEPEINEGDFEILEESNQ